MGCIYIIKNNINGLIYIGKTIDLKRRIKEYKYKSRKLNNHSSYRIMKEINLDLNISQLKYWKS